MSDAENASATSKLWRSLVVTSPIVFLIGVVLHDWLVVLFLAFFFVAWSPVIFKTDERHGLGIYCGIILGLGSAIVFIVFGPIEFYE